MSVDLCQFFPVTRTPTTPENGLLKSHFCWCFSLVFEPHLKPMNLQKSSEQVPRSEVNMFTTEDQRLTSKTGHFSLASGGRKTGDFPEDWGFSQRIEAGSIRNQQQGVIILPNPPHLATGNLFPGGALMFLPNRSCIFCRKVAQEISFFNPVCFFLASVFFFNPDPKRHHVLFKKSSR